MHICIQLFSPDIEPATPQLYIPKPILYSSELDVGEKFKP